MTVSDRSPGTALADIVVTTQELDQNWCHVIGYLAPILAFAAVGAHVSGLPLDPEAAADLVARGVDQAAAAEGIAARFADATRLLVIASGSDRPAGRELVLKIEEGTWLPSAYRDLETFLHGHLPAVDASTALVVILTERERRPERAGRVSDLLRATKVLDVRAAAILAEPLDAEHPARPHAGRTDPGPGRAGLPAPVAALLGSARAAPAHHRAPCPRPRHEPRPDPSRRPALPCRQPPARGRRCVRPARRAPRP